MLATFTKRTKTTPITCDESRQRAIAFHVDISEKANYPKQNNDLLPVRMLNEYAYCPRLFHLMHVEGRWADNAYTADGQRVHSRIDRVQDLLPEPGEASTQTRKKEQEGDEPPDVSRSVTLSDPSLGIVGKLDLVATAGTEALPVDTKRGRTPNNPERSWEPERVQLMAQGLLLREHGYRCEKGVIYYAGSRERVEVAFTSELETRTRHLIELARIAARSTTLPPPLDDSPKCNGCSLNGICLPDETLALRKVEEGNGQKPVRRMQPARSPALPLYVQEQGARIGKKGRTLQIRKEGETLAEVRVKDMDQLVVCGNVGISAQTLHLLAQSDVPVIHLSMGGWFYGITQGFGLRNAYDRAAQFSLASDPQRCLALARAFVTAKGANQRTLLRRNASLAPSAALGEMDRFLGGIPKAGSIESLLGLEGSIARSYFTNFALMLRPPSGSLDFDFQGRNRRPPRDPVNAMLSFGYALLTKECTVALASVGLDPFWGFFHQPRHGRPALALDLMEEFRSLVVDSAVITAVNTGMVKPRSFITAANGCALQPAGRKAFIKAYEARLDQLVTHPHFDYRCSWRQIIRLQAQLLARHLRGDVPDYTGMTTR